MEIIWFILIGLCAGWLAGQLAKGGGFGSLCTRRKILEFVNATSAHPDLQSGIDSTYYEAQNRMFTSGLQTGIHDHFFTDEDSSILRPATSEALSDAFFARFRSNQECRIGGTITEC